MEEKPHFPKNTRNASPTSPRNTAICCEIPKGLSPFGGGRGKAPARFGAVPHKMVFAIMALLVAGCTEPEPWPNADRYEKTETSIVYAAPAGAAENIEAAWSPSAVLPVSESLLIYAARGTRKIIELDVQTPKQRVLFDLTRIEERFTSSNWASGLYAIQDWIIVATPQEELVFCNKTTGEIRTVGVRNLSDALIPADGVPLKNIDFALFGGIAPSPNGVYLALGEQVYHATWDGAHPNTLLETPLEHIAGAIDAQDHVDPHHALNAPLSLHDYTHFAQKDGWLFFWSGRLLKAVKNDMILNITGHGYGSPDGKLDTFFAYALPNNPPLIEHQGILYTPYWDNNTALLRIEITHIDPNTAEVTGSLYDIYPQAGSISTLTTWKNVILSADLSVGNFWQFIPQNRPTDLADPTLIFGPESAESRFESVSTDPHSPYEPNAILAPQAILTFKQGNYHLVYAPTLQRLHLLSNDSFKQAPIWEGSLTHMASDAFQRAWFTQGNTFYFFELMDHATPNLSYVPRFFKSAPPMGVPCDRAQFRLTVPAHIEISGNNIMLYMPEAYRILQYDKDKDEATFLHESGWYKPSIADPAFFLSGLPVSKIEQWKTNAQIEVVSLRSEDTSYLAVINLTNKTLTIGGQKIPKAKGMILAGGGDTQIADGQTLAGTHFEQLHAIAITQDLSILTVTHHGIFETTSDSTWKAWSKCTPETLPHAPENLEISGDAPNRVLFAQVDGQTYACAENPVTGLGIDIPSDWTKLSYQHIKPCQNSAKLVSDAQDAQKICWHTSLVDNAPKCVSQPDDFEIYSLACTDTDLYVSGQNIKTTQNVIMHTAWPHIETFTPYLGTGAGLPDEGKISDIALGSNLGRMAIDGIPWLHLWMKDTCTIWKLPAFRSAEIDENTPVYRFITDPRLCSAQAFAIQQIGTMAIVHENTLYQIEDTEFIPLGKLNGEVIDMIAVGYGFVIMTTDGIYLWERGRLLKRAPNPITIDGKPIDYAKPSNVWPRLTQSPGENAILVPVFEGDRILKIAL